MATEKAAAEAKDLLKWLLGAALVGGGLRAGVGLTRQLGGSQTVLKPKSDVSSNVVDVPIDVSPEQMDRYQQSRKRYGLDKEAGAWDNTLYTLAALGGGAGGWALASGILEKIRKQRLDSQLSNLRGELSGLVGRRPTEDEEDAKVAAWDFLELAAKEYAEGSEKNAGFGSTIMGKLRDAAEGLKGFAKSNPATAALGGGAIAATAVPGTSHIISRAGDVVSGAGKGVSNLVTGPVSNAMIYGLGPIAALSLLYGLRRGYKADSAGSTERAKLKALREKIRKDESKEKPTFRLVPRVRRGEVSSRSPQRTGTEETMDLNSSYSEKEGRARLLMFSKMAMGMGNAGVGSAMNVGASMASQTPQAQDPSQAIGKPGLNAPGAAPSPAPMSTPPATAKFQSPPIQAVAQGGAAPAPQQGPMNAPAA